MGGGGLFYCPDVTSDDPECHLVYDYGFNSGPGLMLISKDDHYLINALTTVGVGGTPKRVVVMDISQPMYPRLVQEIIVPDESTGGPHFITFDHNQKRVAWSDYFVDDSRIQVKVDGDHRIYLARWLEDNSSRNSKEHLVVDKHFRDEYDNMVGVNFNRSSWPHGDTGWAAPHGIAFWPKKCVPEKHDLMH